MPYKTTWRGSAGFSIFFYIMLCVETIFSVREENSGWGANFHLFALLINIIPSTLAATSWHYIDRRDVMNLYVKSALCGFLAGVSRVVLFTLPGDLPSLMTFSLMFTTALGPIYIYYLRRNT